MTHPFMEAVARALSEHGISTLRYNFEYTELGRKRPDRHPKLLAVVASAVRVGRRLCGTRPLLAGGKSMGGRMTSHYASQLGGALEEIQGLVFFGFPLHRPGRPGVERAEHLADVPMPMLFLQGTRDNLADLSLLRPVLGGLGTRASLHVVEGADHSFRVPKRSGRTPEDVYDELASAVARWPVG